MKKIMRVIEIIIVISILTIGVRNTLDKGKKITSAAASGAQDIYNDNKTEQSDSWLAVVKQDFTHFTTEAKDFLEYSGIGKGVKDGFDKGVDKADDVVDDVKGKAKDAAQDVIENASAEESETASELEKVTLVKVIDGDTIWVAKADGSKEKVRFIGIDTPESVNSDASKNNEYGTMASDHTKALLENVTDLYLEYDYGRNDKYGRTLAYVWFSQDTSVVTNMLNARIVADGYAIDKVYEPNHKYRKELSIVRNDAECSGIGLWQYQGYTDLVEGDN